MIRDPAGPARPLAVALAMLLAVAACADTTPMEPGPMEFEPVALLSLDEVDLEDQGTGVALEANSTFFPASTNALNKAAETPGRVGQPAPYVVFEEVGIGEVTLRFVDPTNFSVGGAFFEVRIDGETVGTTEHPIVNTETAHNTTGQFALIDDVIHPGVGLPANDPDAETVRTFQAEATVDVRLALGPERDFDFDWTTFYVQPAPTCFADVERTDNDVPAIVADFNTIQEAVDFAEPGDRILVTGECDENVLVQTNDLHILGVDRPVLTSSDPTAPPGGDRGNLRVRADGVTIDGFVLDGGHYGVRASGSSNVIMNNEVSGMAFRGISAAGSENIIKENQVSGGSRHGIDLGGTDGEVAHNIVVGANRNGIFISGSGHSVSHNEVVGSGIDGSDGVRVQGSGHTLNHNLIAANGRLRAGARQGSGLVVEAHGVSLVHTTVTDNFLHGIVLTGNDNEIVQSTVESNGGSGIRIGGDDNSVNQSRACGNAFAPIDETGGEETFDIHVLTGASSNTVQNTEAGGLVDDGDGTRTRRIQDC